ncbi:21745_t:CDS:2 [Cetraspora pellucida]|uniref:21745_t:CDS:1 n=1 Tax=Cetraspora pellucida TaxID=1433469 RepID=A0A9N9E8N6_9GLOM|nr:21745_t:CDS:2 [Cetraspora pellucida]
MSNIYSEDILNNPQQVGWVGAAVMPSPVTRLPSDQWTAESYNKHFSSKVNTPATDISFYELPPQDDIKVEFEKPSLVHGAKEAVVGKIKETIGKLTRKEYLKESGRDQKRWGKREIKAAKKEGTMNDNRNHTI